MSTDVMHIACDNPHATYVTFSVERPDGRRFTVRQPASSDVLLLRHRVASSMYLTDAQIVLLFMDRPMLFGTLAENGIVTGSRLLVMPVLAAGGLVQKKRGLSIVVFGLLGVEYLAMTKGETSVKKIVEEMSDDFVVEFLEGNSSLVVQLSSVVKHLELSVRLEPPALSSAELAAELDEEEGVEETQLPLALRKGPVGEIIHIRSSSRRAYTCTGYLLPRVVTEVKDARGLMHVILGDLLAAVPKKMLPRHMTRVKPAPVVVPSLLSFYLALPPNEQHPRQQQQALLPPENASVQGHQARSAAGSEGGNIALETQNDVTRRKMHSLLERLGERRKLQRRDESAPYFAPGRRSHAAETRPFEGPQPRH